MTTTPRTRIRELLRTFADGGPIRDDAVDQAIDFILADPEISRPLISQLVRHEAQSATGQDAVKQYGRPVKTPVPVPEAEPDPIEQRVMIPRKDRSKIILDMAKMTKIDLIGLADELEGEAQKANEWSALVRYVADALTNGETVGSRFSTNDLLSMCSRITVTTERRIYIGGNAKPMLGRTTTN